MASPYSFFFSNYIHQTLLTTDGAIIDADSIVSKFHCALIFGGPGTGKTTLLKFIEMKKDSECAIGKQDVPYPIFLQSRSVFRLIKEDDVDFSSIIKKHLLEKYGKKIGNEELFKILHSGNILLLIDGLDEIFDVQNQYKFIRDITTFFRLFPEIQIVISSRTNSPINEFDDFAILRLNSFSRDDILTYANRFFDKKNQVGRQFPSSIVSNPSLFDLAKNPLLLNILLNTFDSRPELSNKPGILYSDSIDLIYSTWELGKRIGRRSTITLQIKYQILENLALYLHESSNDVVSQAVFLSIISNTLKEFNVDDIPESVIDEIVDGVVIQEVTQISFSFGHRSFQDYFVARTIKTRPDRVLNVLNKQFSKSVVSFICDLIDDTTTIIERALVNEQTLLASRFVFYGHTASPSIIDKVDQQLEIKLGNPVNSISKANNLPENAEDIYSDLLSKWNSFSTQGLSSQEKGRRFEEFVSDFCGQFFTVVKPHLLTKNGEFDLLLEINKRDPWWGEYGGDVLVECKNWKKNVPLNEVNNFITKIQLPRNKLAFIVSAGGFTECALDTIQKFSIKYEFPLLIPIDGNSIKTALINRNNFEEFFKERIRDIKYPRKY